MVEVSAEQEQSQEALQEKLKNMSPEELREFQKQQCVFCQIISGRIKSRKIYEDQKCIAILDINPASPGHILLMPKEHYAVMPQMPEEEIGHLFMVSKALSNAMLKGLKAGGTNVFVANGVAAGQRAQHFMIHVIPRKENDGITAFNIPQRQVNEADFEMIRKRIVASIAKVFGIKAPAENAGRHEEQMQGNEKEKGKSEKASAEAEDTKKEKSKKKRRITSKQIKTIAEKKQVKAEKPDLDVIAGLFK